MSSRKLVTSPQVESVRQMANDKGVSREQFQSALDNGIVARFLDVLKNPVFNTSERVWETWQTIRVGTLKTVDDIRTALKSNGCIINDWANDILGRPAFTVSETEQDVELVNVSPAELGLKGKGGFVDRRDVVEQALKFGLELCIVEDGPQAALQVGGQLKNEELVIGMLSIRTSYGYRCVFCVTRNDTGELYLYATNRSDWSVNTRFVFRRRKP